MLKDSPVVIVQIVQGVDNSSTPVCNPLLQDDHNVIVLLEEAPYYIRPNDYYVNRLDSLIQPLVTQTLYVTHYGSPANINVKVSPVNYETTLPPDGVVAS